MIKILTGRQEYGLFRDMNSEFSATSAETDPCILCAFNLGESADEAVKSAVLFGFHFHLPIMILCSYRLIQSKGSEEVQTVKKRYEKMAVEKWKHIDSAQSGIKPFFRTEIGFLSDRIESFVKSGKVRMLILGNNAATDIYEHKGLTLKEFIKKVDVPVLVIPE